MNPLDTKRLSSHGACSFYNDLPCSEMALCLE
uniref:Uncharacterized protein n=1 Tax=Anguilla anguilla TaxID=7936 RepID=A0A0E9UPD9_ANGAN